MVDLRDMHIICLTKDKNKVLSLKLNFKGYIQYQQLKEYTISITLLTTIHDAIMEPWVNKSLS